jgi:hypothetical protein
MLNPALATAAKASFARMDLMLVLLLLLITNKTRVNSAAKPCRRAHECDDE